LALAADCGRSAGDIFAKMKLRGGLRAAIAAMDRRGTVDKSRARAQGNLMIWTLIQVALGGAIGSSLRYLSNVGAMRWFGPNFPYGTIFVNILGSFAMGVLVVFLAHKGGNRFAPLLMTGVLGGFTTFSAFSLDSFTLWQRGDNLVALGYVLGSVVLSFSALIAGVYLTREVFA
jgi:CrcB protein